MRRALRTLAGLLVLAVGLPALGQVTDEDVDTARREVNRLVSEAQELGDAVQAAWARQAALDHEILQLETSIDFARIQLTDTQGRLEEVAVEMYMGSASGTTLSVLFGPPEGELAARIEYLRNISGIDTDVINQLRVFRRELDRQTERLSEARLEQEVLTVELQEMAFQLQEQLGAAQETYEQLVAQQQREEEERRRREEEERRRQEEERRRQEEERRAAATTTTVAANTGPSESETTTTTEAVTETTTPVQETTTSVQETTTTTSTPPSPSSGGGACPVAGAVSFTDTWGAPRSGGRTHQGVDMIAARGTPIVAIYDGRIKRLSSSSLGGKSVWLAADDGDEFYYAHLDGYGDISVGQRVSEGHVIGFNGSTGNAPEWLPHLHFEHHPGGGSAVNPYPLVRSICG